MLLSLHPTTLLLFFVLVLSLTLRWYKRSAPSTLPCVTESAHTRLHPPPGINAPRVPLHLFVCFSSSHWGNRYAQHESRPHVYAQNKRTNRPESTLSCTVVFMLSWWRTKHTHLPVSESRCSVGGGRVQNHLVQNHTQSQLTKRLVAAKF